MKCDQKYGKLEVEGVIQVVVVHNHSRTQDDPYGDDSRCRELHDGELAIKKTDNKEPRTLTLGFVVTTSEGC